MNRKFSFKNKSNSRKNISFNRAYSAKRSSKTFLVKKNISTITVQPPPLLMTNPNNNAKKLKGMGRNFEREELYQINMQLKETVNSLKVELYEAKSQIVKKEREIKKKEKIIEDCCKEIKNPSSLYMKSFDKAKESTLLTLCKEQYNTLKSDYDKKIEEIEILKANIKITKLKEYQIDIDTLKKEMNKLRNLYNNLVLENMMLKNEINELNEYKLKCNEQHDIINKCVKKVSDYNNNLLELELQNEELQMKLNQNKRNNNIMKNQNSKLKLTNEKYLRERKTREHFKMFNTDNINKINTLQKELEEYKLLYNQRDEALKKMVKTMDSQKQINVNGDKIKVFNYQNIQHIEKEPTGTQDENINKIMLLKSLLEEKQKNIDILKNFLYNLNYEPDKIIQNYNPNNSKNLNNSNMYRTNSNNINNNNSISNIIQSSNNHFINNNKSINLNNNNHKSNIESNNNGNINNNNNSNHNNNNEISNGINYTNKNENNKQTDNNFNTINKENNNTDSNNIINNDSKIENNNNDDNNSQLYNKPVINEQNIDDEQGKESYIIPNNDKSIEGNKTTFNENEKINDLKTDENN